MSKNIGSIDRVLRIIIGIALIAWAVLSNAPLAWLGWLGAVPIVTALISWCPAYTLIGVKTCPTDNS